MKGSEVAEKIREIILEKRYMDVGKGAEILLGTSRYKLDRAVGILVNEGSGFTKFNLEVPQVGTGKSIVVPILAAPGVTITDLINDMKSIKAAVAETAEKAEIERAATSARKQAEWDANLAEVKRLLGEGLNAGQIAEKMERKKRTIESWIYWMERAGEKLPGVKTVKESLTSRDIEERYSQYDEPRTESEKNPEEKSGEKSPTLVEEVRSELNKLGYTVEDVSGILEGEDSDLGTPIEAVDEVTVPEFIAYAQENGLGGFTPMILEEYYSLLGDRSLSGIRAALILLQNACSFYKEYFAVRFIYFKK